MSSSSSPLFPTVEFLDDSTLISCIPCTSTIPEPISSPQPPVPKVSRSTRSVKPPIWMTYYVNSSTKSSCFYPMSNYVTNDHLSPTYRASLSIFSVVTEPSSFAEASKNPLSIQAM